MASFYIILGQDINFEKLEGINIRSIGPAGMSGRVTSIDVIHDQPDVIYAGTASGGVWKSTSGGIKWEPTFDKERTQSIGSLVIDQNNPDVIWVGTGEGNPRNSMNSGAGIYRSLDGGKTWKCMGLENTQIIHRIILHRDDPNTIFAATMGSAWGDNPERGVYKTTDGGNTWEQVLYVNERTGAADMVVDPSNPNKLLVNMWEYRRTPWDFTSGGEGSGLYITYDGGENWKRLSDEEGLPKGELGRMGLAFATNKPNIVYALIEAKKNGLYKSTDGGDNWKLVASKNIGGRPFYYSDIFVDPQNENRIFNLHSLVDMSEDGGKTFTTLLPYSGVHPDHHAWWIHPDNPDYMIDGNDGGLNITRDGGKSWRFIPNLPVGQFYHVNYDMDIPYNVYGGMQDNGSWIGPSYLWQQGGIRNHEWQELYFGDGFDVVPRPDNSRYGYAMSQGGNVGYYDRETGHTRVVRPVHPDGTFLRFNWNAAIAQDPFDNCGVYYGSQFLHYSTDCGESWEILSPDLTTNDSSKQLSFKSGGLTIDATQAENHTTVISIEPSPHDKNVIWVGTDDGNLQLTRDGGETWNNLSSKLPEFVEGSWIPQIVASRYNAGEVFVVVNDYRRNNWEPYAYHSNDYGATWKRIARPGQIDERAYVLSIVQDHIEPNLMFLGTDYGLYISLDGGANWQKYESFPSTQIADLKIHPREGDLIIGTFGRAFHILDDLGPFRAMAKSKDILEKPFVVFDAPEAYQVSYKSYDGMHFPADAEFMGENRRRGVMLTYWYQKEEKKKEEMTDEMKESDDEDEDENKKGKKGKKKTKPETEKKEERAKESSEKPEGTEAPGRPGRPGMGGGGKNMTITVFNMAGDTIRKFERPIKEGMNRVYWGMERNGPKFPSLGNRRFGGGGSPGGPQVLPGDYKVVMSYGKYKDSTNVKVNIDPRAEYTISDLEAKEEIIEEYMDMVNEVAESVENLTNAEKSIKNINTMMSSLPDSTQKHLKKRGEEMTKTINELRELFVSPRDFKGIDGTPRLLWGIFMSSAYINSINGAPGDNTRNALNNAKSKVQEAMDKIKAFYDGEWTEYKQEIESHTFSFFEDFQEYKKE